MDSDDWLCPAELASLYACAVRNGADVVQGRYEEYNERTGVYTSCERLYGMYRGEEKCPQSWKERFLAGRANLAVWGRLVRTDLPRRRNLHFQPDTLAEDMPFSILLFLCAEKIYLLSESVMVYRRGEGASLSTRARAMRFGKLANWSFLAEQMYALGIPRGRVYNRALRLVLKGCMACTDALSVREEETLRRAVKTVCQYGACCVGCARWRYRLFGALAQRADAKWVARWARLLR